MSSRILSILFLSLLLPACSAEEGGDEAATAPAPGLSELSDGDAMAFFADHYCNACHEVDEFRIGPAYRDVARRYGDSSEERIAWLAEKIIRGGAGSWGQVPMVDNPEVAPEEALAIARWILELEEPLSPE